MIWFRCKVCFKVFPVLQVHLSSLYLGLHLPHLICLILWFTEQEHRKGAYLEPCQTSKTELFEKMINDWKLLTIFTKRFILDAWQGSECASAEYQVNCLSRFARRLLFLRKWIFWKLYSGWKLLLKSVWEKDIPQM